METFNNDPNFSIVTRGGCNASCDFCFNKEKTNTKQCSSETYIDNLLVSLNLLPKNFYQISITGNEPMLSPDIDEILKTCIAFKERYTNILITTNGTNLIEKFDIVSKGVHHINISRHHYDYDENKKIFKGTWDVTDYEIEKIIDKYSAIGVDVSLNCVINDNTDYNFIMNYIDYAKAVGAFAVRFRKINGDIAMTPIEESLDYEYPILWKGSCPVCRTVLRKMKGLDTYWKSSVLEPADHIKDKVFEVIFDTDGETYKDWDKKRPISIPVMSYKSSSTKSLIDKLNHVRDDYSRNLTNNACGMRIYNSCGVYSSSCGGSSSRC